MGFDKVEIKASGTDISVLKIGLPQYHYVKSYLDTLIVGISRASMFTSTFFEIVQVLNPTTDVISRHCGHWPPIFI